MSLRDRLLGERLLGDPAAIPGPALARGFRRGSEAYAVRCVRALGERDEEQAVDFLLPLLADPRAAVRRAAAASLGHLGRARALPALAAASDPGEEGQLALAVARARCGEDPLAVAVLLEGFERRVLQTWQGPRSPQSATGMGGLLDRYWQALREGGHGEPIPRSALRASRVAQLERTDLGGKDERGLLQSLAGLQHPGDYERFLALLQVAGRREEHALFIALGLLGDPRAQGFLVDALFATDVDPGRGFAQRRLAAMSLGRLGLRASTRSLLRALENEALDYEGRPGAGMGVQYPVRTNLLWALGEIGDPAGLPVLVGYLGNTHGSAFGGFYLPAMDAVTKCGPEAVPALRAMAAQGEEIEAANAVGVLAAMGVDVSAWRADPRRSVAALAERCG